jgi:hypothetical protein
MDAQNTVLVEGAPLNDSKAESELSEEVLALQKREIEYFKLQSESALSDGGASYSSSIDSCCSKSSVNQLRRS